ncbi:MAG: DUF6776 family protein [Pseudomonadales bacterium]
MDEVIGSKQYRSIVVQDRPGQRLLIIVSLVALMVVLALSAYWFGGKSIRGNYQTLSNRYQESIQQLEIAEVKYEDVSQQLANITLGADIDRQAVDNVRAVVREHKQTITGLNEKISFYKGLMAPTERERGLGIRSWEVYPTGDPQRFQFKLVMQQLALKHTVLKGDVTVELVGRQAEQELSFSLDILSEQVEGGNIKLRFKYFQYIDGELKLPEGFVVQRVDIVARATVPKAVRVEKHYGWIVQKIGV